MQLIVAEVDQLIGAVQMQNLSSNAQIDFIPGLVPQAVIRINVNGALISATVTRVRKVFAKIEFKQPITNLDTFLESMMKAKKVLQDIDIY